MVSEPNSVGNMMIRSYRWGHFYDRAKWCTPIVLHRYDRAKDIKHSETGYESMMVYDVLMISPLPWMIITMMMFLAFLHCHGKGSKVRVELQ